MLRIGEFSKLSHLTVKALRYYEQENLLLPAGADPWTGYRFYEPAQLEPAARLKAYRAAGLSIEEIKSILSGAEEKAVLLRRAELLREEKAALDVCLSVIHHLLEEKDMKYEVTVKEVPEMIVYTAEKRLANISDRMEFIPACGAACLALNPGMECAEPAYEFCEYPDPEFSETNVLVRHSEAVKTFGKESDFIHFRRIPAVKVLSIFHRGPYENLGSSYAFLMEYAEKGGYEIDGLSRECYIDGIWNKDDPEDWLTELQLPIR